MHTLKPNKTKKILGGDFMTKLIQLQSDEDKKILLDQYKVVIESINKINEIREASNNWWTSINGALVGVISFFRNVEGLQGSHKQMFIWTIVILGFILCYSWLCSIFNLKKNIDIRNHMLMEFEKHLPAKPFTLSILEVGRERNKGSVSLKESMVPLLFLAGYAFFAYMLYFYPTVSIAF